MQHNNDTQKHQLVQKPPGFTQIFLAWEKVRPVHCKVLCGLSVLISIPPPLLRECAQHANPLSRIMIILKKILNPITFLRSASQCPT